MPSNQWVELKSTDFDRDLAHQTIAILPIGSTEQHGPHLPVQVDTLLATEVARETAKLCAPLNKVVVLPALWVSLAEHHMNFGGSLTLDYETFYAFIRCIVRSLSLQGYRRILILNGHGGNIAALTTIVDRLASEFRLPIASATYWDVASDAFGRILEDQTNLLHACEAETSLVMHLRPELVDSAAARSVTSPATGFLQPMGTHRWRDISHWSCSGVVGVPKSATSTKGRLLLDAACNALANRISKSEFWAEA